jgi:hypothetical protein
MRSSIECIKYMKPKHPPTNRRASDEQLIAAAKIHGTDMKGLTEIAKMFGYSCPQAILPRVRRLMKNEADL